MRATADRKPATLREVIAERQMLTIFLASLLVLVQVLVSFSLIPLYIADRGGSSAMIGFQTSLFAIASVMLRFIFGPVADLRGRRFALAVGTFAFATGHIAIWLSPNLWIMAAARVYQAIGMASYLSAASSFVADLAPAEFRGATIGIYRMVLTAAMMVGPLVGNELIRTYGFGAFFVSMAGMSFIAFVLVLTLRNPPVHHEAGEEPIRPRDVFTLLGNPALRAPYLGILIISIAGGIILTYLTLYAENVIARPALYFTLFAVAGGVGALALGWLSDRFGRRPVVVPAMLCLALGVAVLWKLAAFPLSVFYASAVLAGFAYNGGLSLFVSWVIDGATPRLRATALAMQESGIDAGFGVGIFIFGLLSEQIPYALLFLWLGLFVALGSAAVRIVSRADHAAAIPARGKRHPLPGRKGE